MSVLQRKGGIKEGRRWKTRAGEVAQVVDCVPSKWEALSSNPVPKDLKKKKKQMEAKKFSFKKKYVKLS
jgi:hypothetical protein